MENLHEILVALVRLTSTITVIVLFFLFVVRPLLNYFIVNHEIEHCKKLNEELLPGDFPAEEAVEGDHEDKVATVAPEPRHDGKLSDQQDTLQRLATGDPDRAGELVKQWVNRD